jgi:hypothetical protein
VTVPASQHTRRNPEHSLGRVRLGMEEERYPKTHRSLCVFRRTKIPESPIHFSGVTNFFGPKNEFTSHQFETSVLDPPMSSRPLSNHQTVVKPRASRLNFYEGTIPVSEFVNCEERGNSTWRAARTAPVPAAPVYR